MLISLLIIQFTLFFQYRECYKQLSLQHLEKIIKNQQSLNLFNHFPHFNRTRVPGSKGSLYIRDYISDHFNQLNSKNQFKWVIEFDTFEERGYNFSNIIVTKSPTYGQDYLVIAAHYDTLIKPEGFVGAIDSAVSCSIMLDISKDIDGSLDIFFDQDDDLEMGIKFIFFDGEEAIEEWSPTDSIYGSRHLHSTYSTNELQSIELFVLLDLLGADSNFIPSYFPESHSSYNELSTIENRYSQISDIFAINDKNFDHIDETFRVKFGGYMEDDHLPFLRSGVPVLHLIPQQFPKNWHKIGDNFENIDFKAIQKWSILLKTFIYEYLDIEPQ
ncbi:hypothetical protein WICMUC_004928 [Wickerhamomyces mucosus]|uniref:Peptide hydrolase n=1 Tax=Wickerhamomyces mucosus TaxID=1378264 RepID=A0A9P8PEN7_9ASCO|nr:hypothetical protein WICMUC_004928 [Wickerhamomyces mucosus]